MIRRLKGMVVDKTLTHITLDISGVGYLVAVRNTAQCKLDTEVILFTHLAVRENALDLYGFETRDELEMFEELLKLPKIGPKSAMQILTQADIELLKQSVANEDPTYLSKMSGIGKKSAEKIVVGLKDVFEYIPGENSGAADAGGSDAIDALITLGYPHKDARDALQKLPPEITSTNDRIKEALRLLGS